MVKMYVSTGEGKFLQFFESVKKAFEYLHTQTDVKGFGIVRIGGSNGCN